MKRGLPADGVKPLARQKRIGLKVGLNYARRAEVMVELAGVHASLGNFDKALAMHGPAFEFALGRLLWRMKFDGVFAIIEE